MPRHYLVLRVESVNVYVLNGSNSIWTVISKTGTTDIFIRQFDNSVPRMECIEQLPSQGLVHILRDHAAHSSETKFRPTPIIC